MRRFSLVHTGCVTIAWPVPPQTWISVRRLATYTLVEKGLPFVYISPQRVRSAAKGVISLGSFENMGQGALVPVQMGP
jgi:hypothetical protein